jgi:NADH kinase
MCKILPKVKTNYDATCSKLTWESKPHNIMLIAKPHTEAEKHILTIADHLSHSYKPNHLVIQDSPGLRSLFQNLNNITFINPEYSETLSKVDLIISSGGDGTILYINHMFQRLNLQVPPVLSFSKGGTVGFLMPHEAEEYEHSISRVMNNEAISTNRMRLDCKYNEKTTCVLNEVVIHRAQTQVPIQLHISVNDKELTTIRGDGIIISTPTGSTGYAMSAGSSMVHPMIDCIVITPICPRSLSFRPIVLPSSTRVRIQLPKGENSALASFDGLTQFHMKSLDEIDVQKCKTPFTTIDRLDSVTDWIRDLNVLGFY